MKRPVGSGGPCRVDGENWAWIKKLYLFYVLSRIPLISQELLVLHTTLNTTVLIYSVLLRCFFFHSPDRFYSMWTVWRPFFDFLFFLTKEDGRILFSFDNIFYVGKLLVFNRRMRPDFSYVREDTACSMLQPSVQYGQTRGMILCLYCSSFHKEN